MSVNTQVAAVITRLKSDPQLASVVFDGTVTGNPERYVDVWADTGYWDGHDSHDHQVDVEVTLTIHSVGMSRQQAMWVSDRVRALLLDWKPTIPGRTCWRMRSAGSQPVQKDTDTTPPKFFAVDRFTLRSTPA